MGFAEAMLATGVLKSGGKDGDETNGDVKANKSLFNKVGDVSRFCSHMLQVHFRTQFNSSSCSTAFVVDGSAFGLGDKLHRTWHRVKYVGEVDDGEAAPNCLSNYVKGPFIKKVFA